MKGQLFSMDFVVSVGMLGAILALTLHAAHFSQSFSKPSDKAFAVSEALMNGKLGALAISPSEYGYRFTNGTGHAFLQSNFDVSCPGERVAIKRIGPCPSVGTCILEVRVCA